MPELQEIAIFNCYSMDGVNAQLSFPYKQGGVPVNDIKSALAKNLEVSSDVIELFCRDQEERLEGNYLCEPGIKNLVFVLIYASMVHLALKLVGARDLGRVREMLKKAQDAGQSRQNISI